MKQFFETAKQQMAEGNDVVLVTVIASSGSTPRGSGARMVVTEAGRIYGTIGGGAVEYKSTLMAVEAIKNKASLLHEFCLTRNEVEDLGMICGGNVTVYFHYVPHNDEEFRALADHVIGLIDRRETSWLIMGISEGNRGEVGIFGLKSGLFGIKTLDFNYRELTHKAQHMLINGKPYYVEELVHSGKVFVFGCGHVAQELVPVLAHVGFRCIAVDDRPEFASESLFPDAEQVMLIDFKNIGKTITITENDAVCVMTRGHAYDTDVELQVVSSPAYYIGVIGSRSKIAAVAKILREHGISEEQIASIHSPIGLEIMAETPAEIAISIASEMILERAKRLGK
ncbi:MAG: XdhC family protein [Oscillospiraceae bacterium]